MNRILLPIALVALLAVLTAGCGVRLEDRPMRIPSGELPAALAPDSARPLSVLRERVTVYLVKARRLAPYDQPALSRTPASALRALLRADVRELGAQTALPPGTRLLGAWSDGGLLTVNLSPQFGTVRGRDQMVAVAQVVFTATEFPEVARVRLLITGAPVALPTGNGRKAEGPVTRRDYRQLRPVATPSPTPTPTPNRSSTPTPTRGPTTAMGPDPGLSAA